MPVKLPPRIGVGAVPRFPTRLTYELPQPIRVSRSRLPDHKAAARRFELIDTIGVGPAEARERWLAYLELRDARAQHNAERPKPTDLATRLARGEITVAAATKAVENAEPSGQAADREDRVAQMFRTAEATALAAALSALHDPGPAAWAEELSGVVESALDSGDQVRFENAYELAAWVVPLAKGGRSWKHRASEARFGRPDLVWRYWAQDVRKPLARRTGKYENRVPWVEYKAGPTSPKLTFAAVAEHRDEWLPGVYTAEQVVENVKQIAAREEEEAGLR